MNKLKMYALMVALALTSVYVPMYAEGDEDETPAKSGCEKVEEFVKEICDDPKNVVEEVGCKFIETVVDNICNDEDEGDEE